MSCHVFFLDKILDEPVKAINKIYELDSGCWC
jgi:hypothetical protein